MENDSGSLSPVPILGLLQTKNHRYNKETSPDIENNVKPEIPDTENGKNDFEKSNNNAGRLVVYGDSNCIDDSHQQKRMIFGHSNTRYFFVLINKNCDDEFATEGDR